MQNNTKGFQSLSSGFGAQNPAQKYILEGVALELELRSSDFATLHSQNLLEAAIFQVQLDRDNVVDLLMAGDITENAKVEL